MVLVEPDLPSLITEAGVTRMGGDLSLARTDTPASDRGALARSTRPGGAQRRRGHAQVRFLHLVPPLTSRELHAWCRHGRLCVSSATGSDDGWGRDRTAVAG